MNRLAAILSLLFLAGHLVGCRAEVRTTQKPETLGGYDVATDLCKEISRGVWWSGEKQKLWVRLDYRDTSRSKVADIVKEALKRLKREDIDFEVETIEHAVKEAERMNQMWQKELDGYRAIKE